MAYEVVMPYHLHMPSYFLETFTEYPYPKDILLPPKGVNDFKFIFPLGGSPPFINRGYANDIAPILHILFPDVRNCNTDK